MRLKGAHRLSVDGDDIHLVIRNLNGERTGVGDVAEAKSHAFAGLYLYIVIRHAIAGKGVPKATAVGTLADRAETRQMNLPQIL